MHLQLPAEQHHKVPSFTLTVCGGESVPFALSAWGTAVRAASTAVMEPASLQGAAQSRAGVAQVPVVPVKGDGRVSVHGGCWSLPEQPEMRENLSALVSLHGSWGLWPAWGTCAGPQALVCSWNAVHCVRGRRPYTKRCFFWLPQRPGRFQRLHCPQQQKSVNSAFPLPSLWPAEALLALQAPLAALGQERDAHPIHPGKQAGSEVFGKRSRSVKTGLERGGAGVGCRSLRSGRELRQQSFLPAKVQMATPVSLLSVCFRL